VCESLERIEQLDKCVLFFFCGMRISPRTELYEIERKNGQAKESQNLLEPVFYRSSLISSRQILTQVQERAGGKRNWIIGDGEDHTADIISRMHAHGYSGPLWEHLIR